MEYITLEASDVHAGYREGDVISGLNLRIGPGDFIGLVGPNGSGKTSFIKSMSGELRPREGIVCLSGDDIYGLSPRVVARELAVVPQDTPVAFDFPAIEIVMMGRNPHLGRLQAAGPGDLEITRRAMERAHVWHLADRLVSELSGGERQSVIIAQALAQSPNLLLLDEPTQHLDIHHQLNLLKMLSEMCAEGLAVVMVVHDVNLAAQYCKELIMIREGKEFTRGAPADVITTSNILSVFGVDSVVTVNSVTKKPQVVFLPPDRPVSVGEGVKVHLICGGSTGAGLMRALLERGCYVTAGVLNLGDGDQEVGSALEIKMVVEAPFSRIGDEAHRLNLELVESADAVIVTDVQFGTGNSRNLEAALRALRSGRKVILYSPIPIGDRDFTGGEASGRYLELVEEGAVEVKDEDSLLEEMFK